MHTNIEITRNCNQKCFYCFNDSGPLHKKTELDFSEWKKILSNLYSCGCQSVLITGGEPFLHPEIIEILKYCIGLGLETSILSNGYKVAGFVEAYPALFSEIRLAQISLDSMDANLHNARRGYKSAFTDAIDAINSLQKVCVPIEISTVVSDQKLSQLIDIAKYCELINASLIIRKIFLSGRGAVLDGKEVFDISPEEIIKELKVYTTAAMIGDRFDYVLYNNECYKYFKKYGMVKVEASGKIISSDLRLCAINDLLCQLKVA